MKKTLLNKAADRIFEYFENNEFKNDGIYGRNMNLAFEFADFIEYEADNDALLSMAQINTTHEYIANALRTIIQRGIDAYLGNPFDNLVKTLEKSKEVNLWQL